MIHFEPIPLLEAVFFLANRTAEVSWMSFLDTTFGSSGQRSEALISASHIMTELEHRLNDSITIPSCRSYLPPCSSGKSLNSNQLLTT